MLVCSSRICHTEGSNWQLDRKDILCRCCRGGLGLHAQVSLLLVQIERRNALTTHSGMDNVNGVLIKESPQAAAVASNNGQRIGHVYKKAIFREYTDGSFTQQSARPEVSNIWIQV